MTTDPTPAVRAANALQCAFSIGNFTGEPAEFEPASEAELAAIIAAHVPTEGARDILHDIMRTNGIYDQAVASSRFPSQAALFIETGDRIKAFLDSNLPT